MDSSGDGATDSRTVVFGRLTGRRSTSTLPPAAYSFSTSDNQIPWHGRDRRPSQLTASGSPRASACRRSSFRQAAAKAALARRSRPELTRRTQGLNTLPTRPSCRLGSRKGNSEREWKIAATAAQSLGGGGRRASFGTSRSISRSAGGCPPLRDRYPRCCCTAIWSCLSTLAGFGRVPTFLLVVPAPACELSSSRAGVGVRCGPMRRRRRPAVADLRSVGRPSVRADR